MFWKFIAFILTLGVLTSIDCKELMRFGKYCPMQVLSEQKNTPPCHKKNNSSERKDCNCKINEKAIAEKSEFKIQSSKVYFEIVQFLNLFFQKSKPQFRFDSYLVLDHYPFAIPISTKTIHLLI